MKQDKKKSVYTFFIFMVFLIFSVRISVFAEPVTKAKPDLTVQIICKTAKPSLVIYKEIQSPYQVKVSNKGTKDASKFSVILMLVPKKKLLTPRQFSKVLSPISLYSRKSPVLGKRLIILLKAGQSTVLKFGRFRIPQHIPCGEYNLMAVVDPSNKIPEMYENNNSSICPFFLRAVITEVVDAPTGESYGGMLFPEVAIKGFRFGSTVGDKKVRFGSLTISVYPTNWTSTRIFIEFSQHQECGRYQVYLVKGNQVISNKKSFLLKSWIDQILPSGASPGTQVTISGRNFGATKGSKKVKFGTVAASVISWSTTTIVAVVPSLSPGIYPVTIEVNGEDACFGLDYLVQ